MNISLNELSSYDYFLPTQLRKELKEPVGELLRPGTQRYQEILNTPPKCIICVGDIVSKTFLEKGVLPKLMITDGITKREKISLLKTYNFEKRIIENPAATITSKAWIAIREAMHSEKRIHLFVEGEEDLLTIPVILEADKNKAIFYGQPNEGMVMVFPSEELKERLIKLLMQFERRRAL